MDFKDLLIQLRKLNLPSNQYVIVSSGSLAVRGIRDANDLDILVTEKLWKELAKKYQIIQKNDFDKIEPSENIEILSKGTFFNDPKIATTSEIIASADIINGIRYMNLPLLRKFKEKMGREKDIKDIKLIDQYKSGKEQRF